MINPIHLVRQNPNKFKIIITAHEHMYCLSNYDCKFLYESNDIITSSKDVDMPNVYFTMINVLSTCTYNFLNMIQIKNIDFKSMRTLKAFKTNNSSWVKTIHLYPSMNSAEIFFYTALDMINTCNELFTDMTNVTIFFRGVGV